MANNRNEPSNYNAEDRQKILKYLENRTGIHGDNRDSYWRWDKQTNAPIYQIDLQHAPPRVSIGTILSRRLGGICNCVKKNTSGPVNTYSFNDLNMTELLRLSQEYATNLAANSAVAPVSPASILAAARINSPSSLLATYLTSSSAATIDLPFNPAEITERAEKYNITIPRDLCCPITHLIMVDPVKNEHGKTYERSAILKWYEKNNSDPLMRGKIITRTLEPDLAMKSLIDKFLNDHPELKQPEEESKSDAAPRPSGR